MSLEEYTKRQIYLKGLMAKKASIESQLEQIKTFLLSPEGHGITGSLVDSEGFPIEGADLITIRVQRNRYACLQNDHKSCMKEIATALENLHMAAAECQKAGISLPPIHFDSIPSSEPAIPSQPQIHSPPDNKEDDDTPELPFDIMRRQLQESGPVSETFRSMSGQTLHSTSTTQSNSLPSSSSSVVASSASSSSSSSSSPAQLESTLLEMTDQTLKQFCSSLSPFAVVGHVIEGSPAWTAGLRQDDAVLSFHHLFLPTEKPPTVLGDIEYDLWAEMESQRLIQEVSKLVVAKKDAPIRVTLLRRRDNSGGGNMFEQEIIQITPQLWSGKGLLGCQLDPL